MFESHHVSRHFEKRRQQSDRQARKKQQQANAKQRRAQKKAAKTKQRQAQTKQRQAQARQCQAQARQCQAQKKAAKIAANRRRAAVVKRLPKLSLAVHAASHLILAARATTGMGADHAHFVPLLSKAKTRMSLRVALADAGYDSEANHRAARKDMGVRSLIPATCGRPGAAGPTGHYRKLMRRRLKSGPDKKRFGQRWQAETVNSMIKRNLGSACRSRTPWGRKKDMLLRAVTHNLMIVANL